MDAKFEYMILIRASSNDALVQRLNNLGREGWELVCFLADGEALMKRTIALAVL